MCNSDCRCHNYKQDLNFKPSPDIKDWSKNIGRSISHCLYISPSYGQLETVEIETENGKLNFYATVFMYSTLQNVKYEVHTKLPQ